MLEIAFKFSYENEVKIKMLMKEERKFTSNANYVKNRY